MSKGDAHSADVYARVIATAIKDPKGAHVGAQKAIEFFSSSKGKKHMDALARAGVSRVRWSIIRMKYACIRKG